MCKPYNKRNSFSSNIQTPKIYYRAVGYKKGQLVSFFSDKPVMCGVRNLTAYYPVFEIKRLLKKFKTVAFKFFGNLFLIFNPPCFVLSLFSRALFWMYLYPLYHIYSSANALYCYVLYFSCHQTVLHVHQFLSPKESFLIQRENASNFLIDVCSVTVWPSSQNTILVI